MGFGKKLKKTVKAVTAVNNKITKIAKPIARAVGKVYPPAAAVMKAIDVKNKLKESLMKKKKDLGITPGESPVPSLISDVAGQLETIANSGRVGFSGVDPDAFLTSNLADPGPGASEATKEPLNQRKSVSLGKNKILLIAVATMAGLFLVMRFRRK